MPDQPQPSGTPQAPMQSNSNRITAMLQDLAAQRAAGTIPAPARPQPSAPTGKPPANLPITPPAAPRPVPQTAAPMPMPPPGAAPIVAPKSPPPAPKEAPVAPMPAAPRPSAPPPPTIPPKPVAPAPAPAPIVAPKAPTIPQEGYSAELRTMSADIGSIKVGQAPAGVRQPTPSAPITTPRPSSAAPIPASTPVAPSIVIPPASGGSFKKVIYWTLGAIILVAAIYAAVSTIGGNTEPSVSVSPSPSAGESPLPTLGSKSLRTYFGNPGNTINLQSVITGKTDLMNGLVTVQPAQKQAISIAIQHQGNAATAATFFEDTVGALPADLSESLGTDWVFLAFGQSETFDAAGIKVTDSANGLRTVVIIAVTDASKANQAMQTWESTGLASASAGLFGYDPAKRVVAGFTGGSYRQIPVRYWNFPNADRSIDYAIVTASNNTNYLVLSGSRESAFFAIDQLMQ